MKTEQCLMCVICFFLGYFVADVVSKCGFDREHFLEGLRDSTPTPPDGAAAAAAAAVAGVAAPARRFADDAAATARARTVRDWRRADYRRAAAAAGIVA